MSGKAGWKQGGVTRPRSVPGQTAMDRRVSGLGLESPRTVLNSVPVRFELLNADLSRGHQCAADVSVDKRRYVRDKTHDDRQLQRRGQGEEPHKQYQYPD